MTKVINHLPSWQKVVYLHPQRGIEQQVARRAHNPKVAGSSPAPATKQLLGEIKESFFNPNLNAMEFVVYILKKQSFHNKIYIGFTSNLIQRFYAHNYRSNKGHRTLGYSRLTLL